MLLKKFMNLCLDCEVIEQLYEKTKQLVERVKQTQNNVTSLIESIDAWALVPLFERKDGKKENLLNIEDRAERIQRRYEQIEQTSRKFSSLLEENYKLFFNIPLEDPDAIQVYYYSRF